MKIKYLFVLPVVTLLALSGISLVHAQVFTGNLYFGLKNNAQVSELQEFLTAQGLYSGPITGNFYSLTLNAVKAFQTKQGISPAAGYFGSLTVAAANKATGTIVLPTAAAGSAQTQLQTLLKEVSVLQQQLQIQQNGAQPAQNLPPQSQPQATTTQQAATTTPNTPPVVQPTSSATVSVSAQVTPYGFSWAPVGATSQRGKSTNDEIADVTFALPNGAAILLNTMTITFQGTAADNTGFLSGVKLLDPSGNTIPTSSQTADCVSGGTCSVTFNFANRLVSSAQTYKLIVDDSKTAVAQNNSSVSLYATIHANTDVSYTDASNGTGSLVTLPATLQPGTQIFPLNLNSVTYAQGS